MKTSIDCQAGSTQASFFSLRFSLPSSGEIWKLALNPCRTQASLPPNKTKQNTTFICWFCACARACVRVCVLIRACVEFLDNLGLLLEINSFFCHLGPGSQTQAWLQAPLPTKLTCSFGG